MMLKIWGVNLVTKKVQQYIELCPKNYSSKRFFVHYGNGKCTQKNIGIHKICEVPRYVAEFLKSPNSDGFTRHCFRRTSGTLASDSGARTQIIKKLERWRSDAIAQRYIENSLQNRELIYDKVTHQHDLSVPITFESQVPSTRSTLHQLQVTNIVSVLLKGTDLEPAL